MAVKIAMSVYGSCGHRMGFDYSLSRGVQRKLQVTRMLIVDRMKSASDIAQTNLDELDKERYVSNNTDGIVARRSQMYEINREANNEIKNKFGPGKGKLSNVCTVPEKFGSGT